MILLLACVDEPQQNDDIAEEAADLRLDESDIVDLPADAQLWWGPEVTIEPGADKMICMFGTYSGPDVGITSLTTHQNAFGHHLLLMGTTASALDYPDGTVVDCTDGFDMSNLDPMVLPTRSYIAGEPQSDPIDLPAGVATKLDDRQRWVLQAHYLNVGTEPFLARDAAVVSVVPEDEVETWGAPLVHNHDSFVIPPGEEATVSFDCTTDADWDVVYLVGHMHEWGTSIRLDRVDETGATAILDEPDWAPEYRDTPPVHQYAPGELSFAAGTTLRTTCTWFNDTDEALAFPHEMCASVGVVYPQVTPAICNNGD